MLRILLTVAFSLIASSAWAVCSQIPLNIKDASNNTVAMSSATAADGNCKTYVDTDITGNNLYAAVTSPVTLGSASGGLSIQILSALTRTAVAVDAAPGQVYVARCSNTNSSSFAYLFLYDVAAASVVIGTTAPKDVIGIPPATMAGDAVSLVGTQYSTAISAAAVGDRTGGTIPPALLDCVVKYK